MKCNVIRGNFGHAHQTPDFAALHPGYVTRAVKQTGMTGRLAQRNPALRRVADRARHARAEFLGQTIREVFLHREVDDLLGLDDIARHRFQAAVAIRQANLHALLSVPHQAAESVRRLLQALAAPLPDYIDELLMDLREPLLYIFLIRRLGRRERIEEALVLTGCDQAALHAELGHRSGKTETIHQHADGTDQAGLVHEDLVCCRRHVIAAGCANILDHHIQRNGRILGAQAADLVVDLPGLHRTAARAVDAQDHTLRTL